MLKSAGVLIALTFTFILLTGDHATADLTCSSSTTLQTLAICIRNQMPQSGSNGFVAPNATEQADWRAVVNLMLQGACNFALPGSLAGIMQVGLFNDSDNGRNYCVLMEVLDANSNGFVDRGWGTFIVYGAATRELSHQAPHPISDSTTEIQAITIFKETDSRSYLMAGAHRNANSATSTCQSSYKAADVAHNTANMFHVTNQELMVFYGATSWNAIQWHGMAADTCANTDVYPTHGLNRSPVGGDKIVELRNNLLLQHSAWDVDLPGAGACGLNATDNTQGRLINGVPAQSVCSTAASTYNGKFIHIEQDPNFRNPSDWIIPVKDTWPIELPAAPTNLNATAGDAQVSLSWIASAAATSYRVHRSTTSGGSYSTIATDLPSTSYVDSGVTNGVTYYYVVTAENTVGESASSNQVSATPSAPTVPAAPTGLTARAGKRKITLKWMAASGAKTYNLKRSGANGGPYTTIAAGVTGTTYTNIGLSSGVTYYYVATAVNAGGESGNSNQASAKAK